MLLVWSGDSMALQRLFDAAAPRFDSAAHFEIAEAARCGDAQAEIRFVDFIRLCYQQPGSGPSSSGAAEFLGAIILRQMPRSADFGHSREIQDAKDASSRSLPRRRDDGMAALAAGSSAAELQDAGHMLRLATDRPTRQGPSRGSGRLHYCTA